MQILESGMLFGDFSDDDCFWIEKSKIYDVSLKHLGFKSVEFVLHRYDNSENSTNRNELLFVEAKTTLHPSVAGREFSAEISDISQKFIDALQIVCAAWHGGRKDKIKLPMNFKRYFESGKKIVFMLVLKNEPTIGLSIIGDAISKQLLKENRLWKFDVIVLSEEFAIIENLVLANNH